MKTLKEVKTGQYFRFLDMDPPRDLSYRPCTCVRQKVKRTRSSGRGMCRTTMCEQHDDCAQFPYRERYMEFSNVRLVEDTFGTILKDRLES